MRFTNGFGGVLMTLWATLALMTAGCGKESDNGGQANTGQADKRAHDHRGWWCEEHGVPENLCSLCNNEMAAKCKNNGDWCQLHDRAQSQCFKCEPKLYEKYAAMYQAKFGKAPPRPPEAEFQE